MTMRVTMRDPRRSEDGLSYLLVGQIYTVSDEYGKVLVQRGHAIDTDNAIATEAAANRDQLLAAEARATRALVSAPWILNGASAGQDSGWIGYVAGMRLAYALDSGTTATTFSVDISADGATSLGQAFTGTWASSTVYEVSPPIWLSNQAARFIRFNVLTGGPLSVRSNV